MVVEAACTALAVDMVLGKDVPCWKRGDGLNRRLLQYLPGDYVGVFILLLENETVSLSAAPPSKRSFPIVVRWTANDETLMCDWTD